VQVLSSQQAIAATADTWASMVRLVRENSQKLGRGCVYYRHGDDTLEYLSLFELQAGGKELIGIAPELYRKLLRVIGGEYDFHREFVLLVRQQTQHETKFIVQVGQLRDDGWKGVKTPEQIKEQERADQLATARQLRVILRQQRQRRK
jgi:hypothetical protein